MAGNPGYRLDRGFSPCVLSVIADGFGRHGADVRDLSLALRQRLRKMARDAEEAQELARLCSAMQVVSDRIVADSLKAKAELSKISPEVVSICRCGRPIETGECPTRGRCARGIDADIIV